MDNWIYDNATEDICCFCKANPYSNVLECLENVEDCPYYEEHEKIMKKSEELLQMIARLAKRTHANQEPYEVDELESEPFRESFNPFGVNNLGERISNW